MNKQANTAGAAYESASPALILSVEEALAEVAKNRYSTSRIYNAHNHVFSLKETPEACSSCLMKRAQALRKWYDGYALWKANQLNAEANAQGQQITGNEAPAPNVQAGDSANEKSTETGADVSRETISDLQAIYDKYVTEDMPKDEREGIAAIIEKHHAELTEGETALLADRLEELASAINEENTEKGAPAPNVQAGDSANGKSTETETVTESDLTEGVLILKNKAGENFVGTFNSEDGVTGQLVDAEGKSFKPGTYSNDLGDIYAVQPGGRATYKNDAI